MKRHRNTVLTLALSVACALLPASAFGSTLLSGYGGPGGGAQVILGSGLVNVGSGGAGGRGGGAGSIGSQALDAHSSGSKGREKGATGPKRGFSSSPEMSKTSTGAPSSYTHSSNSQPAAAFAVSDDSAFLGLSDTDLLLMGLASAALLLVAGLTRRLTRTPV